MTVTNADIRSSYGEEQTPLTEPHLARYVKGHVISCALTHYWGAMYPVTFDDDWWNDVVLVSRFGGLRFWTWRQKKAMVSVGSVFSQAHYQYATTTKAVVNVAQSCVRGSL